MSEEKSMDPMLIFYIVLLGLEALQKLIAAGQLPGITMEQVTAKLAEIQAAHDALQNQP